MNGRTKKAGLLAMLAVAPLALTALGCKQQVLCPALGSCGSQVRDSNGHSTPPYGVWALRPGYPSCTEDLYVPANDTRLGMAPQTPTGTPFPEPAVFDWCVLLTTSGKLANIQVRQPRFFYESGPVGEAIATYERSGAWNTKITKTGKFTLDFPAYCVRAFGAQDNRPVGNKVGEPVGPPVDICKQLEVPVREAGLGEGSYFNVICERNPDDPADDFGCMCTFEVSETGGPGGKFFMQDDQTLVHLVDSGFPQSATFCQQGDTLQLTGTAGQYLFDVRGLRTFDLIKVCTLDSDCTSGHCDVEHANCI